MLFLAGGTYSRGEEEADQGSSLPTYPPTHPPTYLTTHPPTHLPTYLPHLPTHPPTYLPTYPPTYPPTLPPTYLPTYLPHPPTYLLTYPPTHLPTYLPTHPHSYQASQQRCPLLSLSPGEQKGYTPLPVDIHEYCWGSSCWPRPCPDPTGR